MAYIKSKKTKLGICFYVCDRMGDRQIAKKIPARSLTEAKQYLKAYEHERSTVQVPGLLIRKMTFSELISDYRAYVKGRVRESTYLRDGYVTKMLERDFGIFLLKDMTDEVLEDAQQRWQTVGLSNKTINNRSILIGTMLKFARERRLLSVMPKLKKLKVDKLRPKYFTDSEVSAILQAADPLTSDYTQVFLNTGLRLNELKQLTWLDIDFFNRNLHVEKSKSYRPRSVPINEAVLDILKRRHKARTAKSVYVFECNEGQVVSDYYHRFTRLLKRLGIEGNIHKLRHTFASNLVRKGVPLYEVQHLLGHASYQTTQRYAHLGMVNLRNAVNLLARCTTAAPNDFAVLEAA